MTKVFLGGTCNNSQWRNELKAMLEIDYFDPVVDDWDEAAQLEEIRQRKICDFVLYTVTPKMTGVYSIAEVVDDSNKRPYETIFCYLEQDADDSFTDGQLRSLRAVANMVKENGAVVCTSLNECARILNSGEMQSMKTISDIIIHLRDNVIPNVTGETQERVFDAIYALKSFNLQAKICNNDDK